MISEQPANQKLADENKKLSQAVENLKTEKETLSEKVNDYAIVVRDKEDLLKDYKNKNEDLNQNRNKEIRKAERFFMSTIFLSLITIGLLV